MYSMTGYGRGVASQNGKTVTIEIKTVNHRFLDWNVKIPKGFLFLEDAIKKAVSRRINRGHIDLYLTYAQTAIGEGSFVVDTELANSYMEAVKKLEEITGLVNDVTVSTLLRVSDIVCRETVDEDEDALSEITLAALEEAIDGLLAMRSKEGLALKDDIEEKLDAIEESLNGIVEIAPQVVADYSARLHAMLEEVKAVDAVDEARLATEVALFADRCAIDEEITRLSTHIKNMRALLNCDEPIGRKLDFLVQEMNREANTTGSKANNLGITNGVLAIKNNIEKIREQAANIE